MSMVRRDASITRVCETCGKHFHPWMNQATRYCCRACKSNGERVVNAVNCDWCGSSIYKKPSAIREKNFCDKECRRSHTASAFRCNCGAIIPRHAKRCKVCAESRRAELERQRTRSCKRCHRQFVCNDNRGGVYCSRKCHIEDIRVEELDLQCVVCGSRVKRTKSWLRKHESPCCSRKCQQKWRATKSWETRPRAVSLPVIKYCEDGHAHLGNSCDACKESLKPYRAAITCIASKRSAYTRRVNDPWGYAITSRLGASRGRKSRKQVGVRCGGIYGELKALQVRRSYYLQCEWKKRIQNKLSNIRKRRRRKGEVSNTKASETEVGREPVQMCFDWVGTGC